MYVGIAQYRTVVADRGQTRRRRQAVMDDSAAIVDQVSDACMHCCIEGCMHVTII